jgi:uncharacterized membrane protein YjjP (DUF1212 family)
MKKMTDNNSIYIKMKHIKELTNSERFEHAKSNTLRKKLKVKTLYYNKRLRVIIYILLCFFFFFFWVVANGGEEKVTLIIQSYLGKDQFDPTKLWYKPRC